MKFRSLMTAICVLATANIVSAAPFAYIANSGTKNVSVIDTADNTIKATVDLSAGGTKQPYAYSVAVGASGQYVYVGMHDTNEVAVIDAARNAIVKTISLGGDQPGGLAVNAAETRLYVASRMSNKLIVIDITGNGASEVGRVVVDEAAISNPEGVVLTPDGLKAYVANSGKGSVAEISLNETTNIYTRTHLISLGNNSQPLGLAISSDGAKLYVSSGLGSTASVVDTAGRTATNLSVNTGNFSLAITPDNSKIYAPSAGYNNMYLINGTNNNVTALGGQNTLSNSPWGSSVNPAGTKLYVTMNLSDNVKVFDTSSDALTTTIPLPAGAKPTSLGDFIGPVMPYTITATQETDCTVLPIGAVPVASGFGRTFTITPTSGACEVFIDGSLTSVGQPSTYTFTNVTANGHTINAKQATQTPYYTLSGNWITSIGGWLVSNPAGISKLSKSAQFTSGSTVILSVGDPATQEVQSWSGDCAYANSPFSPTCTVTMSADKTFGAVIVTKTGPAVGPVYNVTKGTYHQTIAAATAAATAIDEIKVSTDIPSGATTGTNTVTVKMSSQWVQPAYTTTGYSSLALTITDVAVVADGLIL